MGIIQGVLNKVTRGTAPVKSFLSTKEYRNHLLYDYSRFKLSRFKVHENSVSPWLYDSYDVPARLAALEKGIGWLVNSQKFGKDDGSSSYHLVNGWSPSGYPETTGYIIPTLLLYSKLYSKPEVAPVAVKMGEWLLNIQKPSGGWASGYYHQQRSEIVFNTGQIIRGMVAMYEHTKEDKYLKACDRACAWLSSIQSPEGYWDKFIYLNMVRVYDSYVAHPILMANKYLNNPIYTETARKNIYWVIDKKQKENGWFNDADNTVENNLSPILHTISYTIDGIMESGYILNDEHILQKGKLAADALFTKFSKQKYMFDKFNSDWKSQSEYINLTGSAQIAIIWSRMANHFKQAEYLNASMKMNDLLIFTQNRFPKESISTRGAIAGSFPIWGDYQKFNFPNWATKYFCDSLMLEMKYTENLV